MAERNIPGNGVPGSASPKRSVSRTPAPRNTAPANTPPGNSAPRNTSPGSSVPRNAPPRKPRKNRRKAFRRGLLIYSVVFLMVGFAALFVFSRYLAAYEQGRGTHAVQAWMEGKSEEDYRALLLSEPVLTLSEFEKNEDIINAYFDASCAGKNISCRETAGVSTAEKPVYSIRAGSADILRVSLRPGKSVGFGFHSWEVESVAPYISPYALRSVTVAVETLADAPLYLNDVAIDGKYLVDDALPLPSLSTLESRYTDKPAMVRYEIPGLYGALTVTDAEGNEISATEENGMPVYRPSGSGGYHFSVTVPAGSTVKVCGTPLTEAELSGEGINPLQGLERFLGEGCSAAQLTYSVSGLYRRPEIEVIPPAHMTLELEQPDENTWIYTPAADEELKETHLARVKAFFADNMGYAAGDNSYLQPVLEKTLYGTELYNYFSNSTAAMIWASDTKISYDYINYEDFVSRGEDCFTCSVSYKATLTSRSWYSTNTSQLEDSYILAFVRHQGVWYAASMSLVDEGAKST